MKQTLINVQQKEVRVAILEKGTLVELFIENPNDRTIVGNVYKGKVTDIRPGIKAVFIDIGLGKNSFLHFDDIKFDAINSSQPTKARLKKPKDAKSWPPRITEYLKKDMEIIVQVLKDPISTKGSRVTTNISLPGRYLVMLPFSTENGGGVSRKIESYKERRRLKGILNDIKLPESSFIIRTSGIDRDSAEISGDVELLKKIWANIKRKSSRASAPKLLLNDHDLVTRVARDILQPDMDAIWIDSKPVLEESQEVIKTMIPELHDRVKYYEGPLGMFDHFEAEKQIIEALRRKVWLKNGGTLIFDEMEAMTAIDVNTGKFTGKKNAESTILATNLEAAGEVARQLRLRDIGGVIVVDFIDMQAMSSRRKLVEELERYMHPDRAKHTILPVNDFGLVSITRKRVRESLRNLYHHECPQCQGEGMVLTRDQVWRAIEREFQLLLTQERPPNVNLRLNSTMKSYVEENHLENIQQWRDEKKMQVHLIELDTLAEDQFEFEIHDPRSAQKRELTVKMQRFHAWDYGDQRTFRPHTDKARALCDAPTSRDKKAAKVEQVQPPQKKEEQKQPPQDAEKTSTEQEPKAESTEEQAAVEAATPDATSQEDAPKRKRRRRRGGRRHNRRDRNQATDSSDDSSTEQKSPEASEQVAKTVPQPVEPAPREQDKQPAKVAAAESQPTTESPSTESDANKQQSRSNRRRRYRSNRSRPGDQQCKDDRKPHSSHKEPRGKKTGSGEPNGNVKTDRYERAPVNRKPFTFSEHTRPVASTDNVEIAKEVKVAEKTKVGKKSAASASAPSKKAAARKSTVTRKTAVKKAAPKPAARKVAPKKAASKKTSEKKIPAKKKAATAKTAVKKTPAKKTAVKKAATKKVVKKTVARKSALKKTPAKKAVAKTVKKKAVKAAKK